MQLDPETIRKLARFTLETRPEELSCDDWIHMVGEYVEAAQRGLPLNERQARVARHAAGCATCHAELEVLRELVDGE
ncbi:MAG: hypothetical protein WD226_06085 [Planctomycetota bacterium]